MVGQFCMTDQAGAFVSVDYVGHEFEQPSSSSWLIAGPVETSVRYY
jgi:hypothetical protein